MNGNNMAQRRGWPRHSTAIAATVMAAIAMLPTTGGMANASTQSSSGRTGWGYTGKHVHGTWAGSGVGAIAWTTSLSVSAYKPCRTGWTTVHVDGSWDSSSLHNGAKLTLVHSVQTSDGRWYNAGRPIVITKAIPWPGHPATGGRYRFRVPTPGGIHVTAARVTSWINNGGAAYGDPTGSADSVSLQQSVQC
jgi:hypothetical protein